jgi:hypothetical protein
MKDIASRRKTGGLDWSVMASGTVERITVDSERWTVVGEGVKE